MLKIEGENPQKDQHQDQTEERMKGKSEVDSSAGDGQGITLLGVPDERLLSPPIDLRHWSCSKSPEGSLLLPLHWRMVSVERLPHI